MDFCVPRSFPAQVLLSVPSPKTWAFTRSKVCHQSPRASLLALHAAPLASTLASWMARVRSEVLILVRVKGAGAVKSWWEVGRRVGNSLDAGLPQQGLCATPGGEGDCGRGGGREGEGSEVKAG